MTQSSGIAPHHIFSVSKLTQNIKLLLEEKYPLLWIFGEISNLRIPSSGHAYFTLKDKKAQIAAVIFKGQLRHLQFQLKDGLTLVGMGRISVYEPRGTYQIILEYVEPKGAGALQLAFEQLKEKLAKEGLFDNIHKRRIPLLSQKTGIVTSASGAVIQDILKIALKRYPNSEIDIYPVNVQGAKAQTQIVKAINTANERGDLDVLILARGGGSIEDLAAYNSEAVARAIYASTIAVVSAIGHETDFTIADFVADIRASTPSAAAEIVFPKKEELQNRCLEYQQRARRAMLNRLSLHKEKLLFTYKNLRHPKIKIQEYRLYLDDYELKLSRSMYRCLDRIKSHHSHIKTRFETVNIYEYIEKNKSKHEIAHYKLNKMIEKIIEKNQASLSTLNASLLPLNPKSVLKRGYSITRTLPLPGAIVKHAQQVKPNDALEIILASGRLRVNIDKIC
ncbi:MAG: exodeoxyribonuclease VII large subunit [Desulfobacteraceae bacterium]|nr:exodeoxyribonuclease VII large subunit [Desulfobacteraceae bacterium]